MNYESLDSDIDDTVAHFSEWRSSMPAMPSEAFDQMNYEHIIVRMIEEITAIESPVSLAQVARRICMQFNISRATQRILARIQNLAKKSNVHIDERHHQIFFWCNTDQINDFSTFRKHTADLKIPTPARQQPGSELASCRRQKSVARPLTRGDSEKP